MEFAEHLIEQIEKWPRSSRADRAANDLLKQFFRGYPIEHLRLLLNSQNADVISAGTWIASELGERSKPVLNDVLRLLDHPSMKVRFWALECLLWVPENGTELAKGLIMMNDVEPGMRWKALDLVSRLSDGQLEAALSSLKLSRPNSSHIQGLEFLLNPNKHDLDSIVSNLNSADSTKRKYGLIAAARSPERMSEALRYAASLQDPDLQSFARTKLGASG